MVPALRVDAALRGLRVIVLDQNDMCSGTSAASSRLIHGGLRYLEYGEIPLVFESLRERITLRKIAAHLVKPLRICYTGLRRGKTRATVDSTGHDCLRHAVRWQDYARHDMLSRDEMLKQSRAWAARVC